MRKIAFFFFSIILVLQGLILPSDKTFALSNCQVSTIPSQVTTNEKSITLKVGDPGLVSNKDYYVWFINHGGPISDLSKTESQGARNFRPDENGIITIQNVDGTGRVNATNQTNFAEGRYDIKVTNTDQFNYFTYCLGSFTVSQATVGGSCTINFLNQSFTVNDDIIINASNLGGNSVDGRRVVVKRKNKDGDELKSIETNVQELSTSLTIGKLEAEQYYIEVKSGKDIFASTICFKTFTIGERGGFGGEVAEPTPQAYLQRVCDKDNEKSCSTALGDISTDPQGFVGRIFGILLSLAGGVAIILIIISGYRLMASGGNPEKVQQAREQLTSAIIGLLFVIFSLSILQFIGVDILHIPGLTK